MKEFHVSLVFTEALTFSNFIVGSVIVFFRRFCFGFIFCFILLICAILLVALQCIVQSYLQWLQDSDYNPNCSLCNDPLTAQDTVRLVCYGEITKLLCNESSSTMSIANLLKNDFAHL